jgi:hypothetical protein
MILAIAVAAILATAPRFAHSPLDGTLYLDGKCAPEQPAAIGVRVFVTDEKGSLIVSRGYSICRSPKWYKRKPG